MAVEIGAGSETGESVSLTGADAERFIDEVLNPSADERRLRHLELSDEAYRRMSSPEPIRELPGCE
jgi:hypothetical protein